MDLREQIIDIIYDCDDRGDLCDRDAAADRILAIPQIAACVTPFSAIGILREIEERDPRCPHCGKSPLAERQSTLDICATATATSASDHCGFLSEPTGELFNSVIAPTTRAENTPSAFNTRAQARAEEQDNINRVMRRHLDGMREHRAGEGFTAGIRRKQEEADREWRASLDRLRDGAAQADRREGIDITDLSHDERIATASKTTDRPDPRSPSARVRDELQRTISEGVCADISSRGIADRVLDCLIEAAPKAGYGWSSTEYLHCVKESRL